MKITEDTRANLTEETRLDFEGVTFQEGGMPDTEELTFDEISELVEEATMLRWSSKPTTSSGRCC